MNAMGLKMCAIAELRESTEHVIIKANFEGTSNTAASLIWQNYSKYHSASQFHISLICENSNSSFADKTY